ncbi:3158_t:CDS:2, partial [Paraglomus occultum]
MSSELDLLRQENAKLVAENAELKHKNSNPKQIISPVCSLLPITSQSSSPSPIEDHSDKEYSI